MKILRVGDPHAKVNNLEEMRYLIEFVADTAFVNKVDRIEILGDLFHSHAVLRLEVQEFWMKAFTTLGNVCETVALVGNHDLSGDYGAQFSSLSLFSQMNMKNVVIIEKSQCLGVFGYVPYIHDPASFIHNVKALSDCGARVLVCHQTIQGSRYETGFYAPDGISTEGWADRFKHVISGHIHAEQSFSNVVYPGTARWDTAADANQRKGIWIYDHAEDGSIVKSEFISTDKVCSPLMELTYCEGDKEPEIPENARVSLSLKGSSDWVNREKVKFKGRVSLKTKYTDVKKTEKRQTGNSFEDFLKNLYASTMDREHLLKLAKEMNIV